MKRCTLLLTVLAASLAANLGCSHQCFITEADLAHYREIGVPDDLPCDKNASIIPGGMMTNDPATVLNPGREIRYITLREALALALEQGTVGVQSPFFPGSINDLLASFNGRFVGGSDAIRVLALDPAISGTDVEASLSKFDARWFSSMNWTTTDRPVGTPLDTFQAAANQVTNIDINAAQLNMGLVKPLPTGGVTSITFRTDYELSNLNPRVNPSYRPNLQFAFEQPLLQGFGVDINQVRATHPGSTLTPFNVGGRVEGILITRLRFDQQRAEFERNVNYLVLNTEIAYWNLYGTYWTLYTREQALRQAFEAWRINKARYEAGRIAITDLAQSRRQYELFRGQRIAALGDVLERERQLRGFLGLPIEDGFRLVPSDKPTLAPYHPDWQTALNEALALRPELVLARHDLKFRQLELMNQRNLLLPDLRFTSTYDVNGIGTHLGGGPNDTANAFGSLASNQFHSWGLGLRLDVPIGFRDAHAAVRFARLNLTRSYAVLKDQEDKAARYLELQYRRIFETYEQIKAQRSQRLAAAEELDARFKEFLAGKGTLDILLEAQRVWADALRAENDNVVQYNNALAQFQFAKGTLLAHDSVYISEGALPKCAQLRAVEHERQRGLGLVARERQIDHPPCDLNNGNPGLPAIDEAAPALPALPVPNMFEARRELPEAPKNSPLWMAPVDKPQVVDERIPQWVITAPAVQQPATPATTSEGPAPRPDTSKSFIIKEPAPVREKLSFSKDPEPAGAKLSFTKEPAPLGTTMTFSKEPAPMGPQARQLASPYQPTGNAPAQTSTTPNQNLPFSATPPSQPSPFSATPPRP